MAEANKMVADVHWHLLTEEWFPEAMWKVLAEQLSGHVLGEKGGAMHPAAEEFRRTVFPKFWDPEGEVVIKKMDECGIDKTFMMSDDFGVVFEEPEVSILEQNKAIADLAAKHAGRLLPCCSVDPRRKDGIELLETCIKDYGMFGVGECHPDTGWNPTEREAYVMFEKLQEWGVPAFMHTGLFFPPLYSRLDHPMLLDDVCCDFPELVVVAGHSGRLLWWRTVAHMAGFHPNFYGDLAGFQTMAFNDLQGFCALLREYIDTCGANKIMWGSDDPVYDAVGLSTQKYLDIIRDLPNNSAPGIEFSQEEIDLILGGNAQRVFNL